ncbi:MAG: hypothetical protein DHS80DRAFT_29541 [Piptocephalis tieghemiana]|nr:MAG: hypothetical protein DHS80DRAFT_29541 [Piptocephalis tieghemiana]
MQLSFTITLAALLVAASSMALPSYSGDNHSYLARRATAELGACGEAGKPSCNVDQTQACMALSITVFQLI